MELEDVKKFLEDNADNEDVKKYVDSLSDKRVNQARSKWDKELDQKVNEEIERRREAEKAEAERLENIENRFKENRIDTELGRSFLPENIGAISEDELEPVIEKAIEQAHGVMDRLAKERYSGKPPEAPAPGSEPDEAAAFRKAMGL